MATREPKENPLPRTAYSVDEVAQSLGLSDWAVRDLLNRGEIPSRHVGTRRLIPADAFARWLEKFNEQQTA